MRNVGIAVIVGGLIVGMAATASAQQPAQELAMATAGPTKDFVVFANKDNHTLSPTALKIVRQAASEAGRADKVTLVGRADETAAVKAALVRQGVPSEAIAVHREARAPIARPSDGLSDSIDRGVQIRL